MMTDTPTDISSSSTDKKPNEAHVETCGAGYSEYAMCDSPEACADLRNAPVVEPESCRYTQPDGTRCSRPGEPKHGMCGPHYWARDDEGHAPIVEPEPRCVRGLPAGNCCERYDTCELVDAEACSPDDYETGPEPKECPKCHVPWFGVCKACGIDMRKPVLDSTTYPKVRGKCPGCGGETLFLGSGGFVTCSLIGCDHPTSASELLHEWQVP